MRISDWSSDVCSSDLGLFHAICHGEFAGFFVKKTGSLAFRPIKFQVALILTETAIVGIEGNSEEACRRLAIAERGALFIIGYCFAAIARAPFHFPALVGRFRNFADPRERQPVVLRPRERILFTRLNSEEP